MRLGDIAPDFTADTTQGRISFHDWCGDSWCLLFSHPKDFTPVCTTELGAMARALPEFEERGVKIIGLGMDPVSDHIAWSADIEETQGAAPTYPIIGDTDLAVAKLYNMLPADAGDSSAGRSAADNHTVRSAFIIAPDKRIQMMMIYPMTSGRSVEELLRVVDSIQLTAKHQVATPAGWQPGDDVMIVPSVSDEEARERFPDGWRGPKPYMRIVEQPR